MSESKSRRKFVTEASLTLIAATLTPTARGEEVPQSGGTPLPQTPGAPPAFGTSPAVGPQVSAASFAEAEKIAQFPLTAPDRAEVAGNWRQSMAALYERRVGPKKVTIPESVAPYSTWKPLPSGPARTGEYKRSSAEAGTLPKTDSEIAFSPVWKLARWIETRKLTSERLTRIYLERIRKYDSKLRCVITATPEFGLKQARVADAEIAAGHYRGALHGMPWGGKDLLDTAGIATTYGAEPFRDRVPTVDSAVVARLHAVGAVMVAKLSMGALALNDIWFGGQTMNPWLLEEGASGSSAGPGAATAAGLVAFSIGSETEGSIVSPTMRCGITGLRPTFGRVPRTGAMTLCWSLDKLGPMTRSVEDAMLVLHAIAGPDPGDLASHQAPLAFYPDESSRGLRVGYFPVWMKEAPATDVDRAALRAVQALGAKTVPVTLPDWPYGTLNTILFAEAAAAFEEITLDHRVDQLREQVPDAWPNSFRQARFLSAVDLVQTDRFRRMVAMEMARIFSLVDVVLVPSLRDEMLTIGNFTGHPSLTLRAGFVQVAEARSDWAPDSAHPLPKFSPARRVPHGVTLIGRLYEEGTIALLGLALEKSFAVSGENPDGFSI